MSTIEQVCWLLFRLTISFDEAMTSGVACNINSLGFHVLCKATEEVVGHVKPYSITGTLPLIRELQVLFSSLSSSFLEDLFVQGDKSTLQGFLFQWERGVPHSYPPKGNWNPLYRRKSVQFFPSLQEYCVAVGYKKISTIFLSFMEASHCIKAAPTTIIHSPDWLSSCSCFYILGWRFWRSDRRLWYVYFYPCFRLRKIRNWYFIFSKLKWKNHSPF